MNKLFLAVLLAVPALALAAEPMVSPLRPVPPPQGNAPGPGDTVNNMGEWCKSIGIGAERMAEVRDKGTPRNDAIDAVSGGEAVPDPLRGSFEAMADTAYQHKDLPPTSVKMLGFSACMMSQIGMLSPESMSRLETIVKACRKSPTTPETEFESCVDRDFAALVNDLVEKSRK